MGRGELVRLRQILGRPGTRVPGREMSNTRELGREASSTQDLGRQTLSTQELGRESSTTQELVEGASSTQECEREVLSTQEVAQTQEMATDSVQHGMDLSEYHARRFLWFFCGYIILVVITNCFRNILAY